MESLNAAFDKFRYVRRVKSDMPGGILEVVEAEINIIDTSKSKKRRRDGANESSRYGCGSENMDLPQWNDLSLNALTGNILLEITLFKGLAMLNLSHNALSGEIPSNIGDMIDLQSLDLSFNRLSGKIPDSVNLLDSLGYMNLSYNNFSGKIPAGTRFDILYGDGSAYIGNEQLCGAGNLINCNDKTSSSSEDTTGVEDSRDRLLFIGVVVSGYVVSFFGYFGVLCLKGEQHRKRYWKVIEKIAFKIVNFMQGKENL
ncbi:receptor-like protein 56 [Ricinus communis]|uniref:receptor-like protein 56 n=1 Tax=Ricinus communis TaxID=3988 RepID=UPI000772B7C7|nr:receptor-like protein 56 [Ricinus communis]|eukprot:XP_015583594.1 putative receptor-like protein 8 [Ricinus communis]